MLVILLATTACSSFGTSPTPPPYKAEEAKYTIIELAPSTTNYYYTNSYTSSTGAVTLHGYWSVPIPLKGLTYTDKDLTIGGQYRIEPNK